MTETQFPEPVQVLHDTISLLAELRPTIGLQISIDDVTRLRAAIDDMQVRLASRITGGVMDF